MKTEKGCKEVKNKMTNEINHEEIKLSVVIPPIRTSLRENLEPNREVGRQVWRFIRNRDLAHEGFEDELRINRRVEYQYSCKSLGAGILLFLESVYSQLNTNTPQELYFGDYRNFEANGRISSFELSLWNQEPVFDSIQGFINSEALIASTLRYEGGMAETNLWVARPIISELISDSNRIFSCTSQRRNTEGYGSVNLYELRPDGV